MEKIIGMQEKGQFDALSQRVEICDECRGTDVTSFELDHFSKSVLLTLAN